MIKDFAQLNNESIQNIIVMYNALSEALTTLSNLGVQDPVTLSFIEDAKTLIADLEMILKYYVDTRNDYQKTFDALFKRLDHLGVAKCVMDLATLNASVKCQPEDYSITRMAS